MKTKTTIEIAKWELDYKEWVALEEVKNIKKELKAEFFKSFGFQTVGVLSKINKILNKAFKVKK